MTLSMLELRDTNRILWSFAFLLRSALAKFCGRFLWLFPLLRLSETRSLRSRLGLGLNDSLAADFAGVTVLSG